MIRFVGYISELCSFLVVGMISYNIRPFEVDKRWLAVFLFTVFLCRYACVTGVLDTIHRWLYPKDSLITHPQVCILFYFIILIIFHSHSF